MAEQQEQEVQQEQGNYQDNILYQITRRGVAKFGDKPANSRAFFVFRGVLDELNESGAELDLFDSLMLVVAAHPARSDMNMLELIGTLEEVKLSLRDRAIEASREEEGGGAVLD